MGWSSANEIFNPVARALINTSADDTTKRKVLGDLIKGLQDGDWDTEDESLEDFLDDPAIVAAFADHGVHTQDGRCCARTRALEVQERITLALAERFADGAPEDQMCVQLPGNGPLPVLRGPTPQEAAEVAAEAIRDLLGGEQK
ncbi:hypothetical protein [Streptomyces sp. ISL-98]|uniref:hypothetical protein n=1 Tax=Streptomyces sp. ISL-98 TaxID=2819192 RepID=UPI002034EC53|nr:hypothetical protein [Streptomyces sp. ISL-98]